MQLERGPGRGLPQASEALNKHLKDWHIGDFSPGPQVVEKPARTHRISVVERGPPAKKRLRHAEPRFREISINVYAFVWP